MKQLWAVILTALMLGGCRSSQPTTNPFMRTTVPPPGTQGMMVMPGEPYPAGTAPPVVTTPGMPVTPVPAQGAPVVAPPPPPKQERFQPPGGSYLYHQSSNDAPRAGDPTADVQVASAPVPSSAVRQAAHFEQPSVGETDIVAQPPSSQTGNTNADIRGDPPEKLASVAVQPEAANSTIRIVGGSPAAASVQKMNSAPRKGVLRMTAGDSRQASTDMASSGALTTQVALRSPQATSPAVANAAGGEQDPRAVMKVSFQSVAEQSYAHTPNYRNLRGRLEYSQSLRRWKLRYIPIDGQTDAYGGSMTLGDFPALASYQPGDMVAVRGRLAGGNTASDGFSRRYEVESIAPLSQ
jgi:hypothetical protein